MKFGITVHFSPSNLMDDQKFKKIKKPKMVEVGNI